MIEYDAKTSLQHFPAMSMAKYGLNPYQENRYRVVFAPSRRHLVFGEWPDGSQCAHWVKSYPDAGNHWVLEGWRSALEIEPRGKEYWERNLLIIGPWPERGDYELIHMFLEAPPTDGQVEKLITWSKAGRERISFGQTLTFNREDAGREKQQRSDMADAMLKNRLPAFGARAFAGAHGRRRSHAEDAELKTAEQLGLPTTPGMRTGRRAQKIIEAA